MPSIIVPFFSDQPFWGYRVFDLGAGTKPILHSELTADKLATAISKAVKDKKIQATARQLGDQIGDEDGVKNAVTVISSIVNKQLTRRNNLKHL